MSDPARARMTVDEFLVWDDGTDTRHELIGGEPVAMAPPAAAHGALAAAIAGEFRNRLRRPCRAISEAGIRLPNRDDTYLQADIAITCRPLEPGVVPVAEPVVVVEVLSPSTAEHDRGYKLAVYREIPSVREILLIESTRRRAELWRRAEDGWFVQDVIGDGTLHLASVEVALAMAELYDGIA